MDALFKRYQGHLSIPEVGLAGQRALGNARVLCVGAGGLGSPALLYLAAAGVGHLGVLDADTVDESNLHRQILFRTADIGAPKAEVARATLLALNPEIEIVVHRERLNAGNAEALLAGYDVIVDGTDNFPTRYAINDACVKLGKPDVWASVFRFEGQVAVFDARRGPCYRCLFPAAPPADQAPSCAEAGVLGVLPGIMGTLQALEAIKLILGIGEPAIGRLLVFDALELGLRSLEIERDPACAACGNAPNPSPAPAAKVASPAIAALDTFGLQRRLAEDPRLQVVDCREPFEWEICHLEGSRLIPLRELPGRLEELDRDRPVVVVCHHGPRSYHAAAFLLEAGFGDVAFLDGGLHAWSYDIDPGMARY